MQAFRNAYGVAGIAILPEFTGNSVDYAYLDGKEWLFDSKAGSPFQANMSCPSGADPTVNNTCQPPDFRPAPGYLSAIVAPHVSAQVSETQRKRALQDMFTPQEPSGFPPLSNQVRFLIAQRSPDPSSYVPID